MEKEKRRDCEEEEHPIDTDIIRSLERNIKNQPQEEQNQQQDTMVTKVAVAVDSSATRKSLAELQPNDVEQLPLGQQQHLGKGQQLLKEEAQSALQSSGDVRLKTESHLDMVKTSSDEVDSRKLSTGERELVTKESHPSVKDKEESPSLKNEPLLVDPRSPLMTPDGEAQIVPSKSLPTNPSNVIDGNEPSSAVSGLQPGTDEHIAQLNREFLKNTEELTEWLKQMREISKVVDANLAAITADLKQKLPEYFIPTNTNSPPWTNGFMSDEVNLGGVTAHSGGTHQMTLGNQTVARDQFESATSEDLEGTAEPQSSTVANVTKKYLDQFNLPTKEMREYFAQHQLQLREHQTSKCSVCEKMYEKLVVQSNSDKVYYEQNTKAEEKEQDMPDRHPFDSTEPPNTRPALTCADPTRWSWKCILPSCNFECHLLCVSLITSDLKCTEGKLGISVSPYLNKLFEHPADLVSGQQSTGVPEEFCYYHGNSFKLDDFKDDAYKSIIPAYVVQRHDWNPKPVCPSAAQFLKEVKREIDLKVYNNIYS